MICENEEHAKPSTTGRIQSESRSNPEGSFSCSADPRRWRGELWPGIFYHVYWDPRRRSVERGQPSGSCLWTQSGAILLGAAQTIKDPPQIVCNFSRRFPISFVCEIWGLMDPVKIFRDRWLHTGPLDTPQLLISGRKHPRKAKFHRFPPRFRPITFLTASRFRLYARSGV